MPEKVYDFIVGHRRTCGVVSILVSALLSLAINAEIDSSLRIWFLDDDPDVISYDAFLERFETDEFIVIGIELDDVFTPEALDDIERLTGVLVDRFGEENVTSLANTEIVERVGSDLTTHDLYDEAPSTPAELEQLRQTVHTDRLLEDLVSEADDASVILLEVEHFEDYRAKSVLAQEVSRIVAETLPGRTTHLAGMPIVDDAMLTYSERDLALFAPLTVLVVILFTFLFYRSVSATLFPVLVVALSLGSAIGIAGLFGVQLNMITTIVIPLALAIGVANCVHLLACYRERLGLGDEKDQALKAAWLELWLPCSITSVTTACGLASLLVTELQPLRQFGWMGALTVIFALIYSLVLFPVTFSYLPAPKARVHSTKGPIGLMLHVAARTSWRFHRTVLIVAAAICVTAVLGLSRVEVGADFARYFGPDDPVLVASTFIDENLGGTGSLEVIVEAPDVRRLEVLESFQLLEEYLLSQQAVDSVFSPASLTMLMNERWFGDPERYRLPDSWEAASQLLAQLEGEEIHSNYFSTDYRIGRLSARIRSIDYRQLIDDMDQAEQFVANTFPGDSHAQITGIGKLVANLDTYIVSSQIRSFGLAFTVIALLIAAFFRSFRFGLWALVPNALPLMMVIGAMGWFGILVDVATVMIASILIGLIVDDTVHFLARFRLEEQRALKAGEKDYVQDALYKTGTGTGRALLTTSLILAFGFWTNLFSNFVPNQSFGLMSGIAVSIALICDLIVLPAVIRLLPLLRFAQLDGDAKNEGNKKKVWPKKK